MRGGVLAGYPVIDVKVAVYDGQFHPVDSNEMAFKTAARLGFQDAVKGADAVLLEPMAHMKITVPESYAGAVMGGTGEFELEVSGYEQVPHDVQQRLAQEYQDRRASGER